MARIRGKNTSPERTLRAALWAAGLRYRLHGKALPGRPDLVFFSMRTAVFIDGCFWHGCPDHYVRPRSRNSFWDSKLIENVERDRRQTLALEEAGWRVFRIWEHSIREDAAGASADLVDHLSSGRRQGVAWRVVKVEFLDPSGQFERRYLQDLRRASRSKVQTGKRSTRKTGRIFRKVAAPGSSALAIRGRR